MSDCVKSMDSCTTPRADVARPVVVVPDCVPKWRPIEDEADQIVAMADSIERNRKISAHYAKVYLDDERLVWAGTAAFASKQVGCAMVALRDHSNDLMKNHPIAGQLSGEILVLRSTLGCLARGNAAVFKDIYPIHRFFQKYGYQKLKKCAPFRTVVIKDEIVDAFFDVERASLEMSALTIALHEQLDILQPKAFDPMMTPAWLNQLAVNHGLGDWIGALPTRVVFSAQCQGSPSEEFTGSNPALFSERWPFAISAIQKFIKMRAELKSALQEISGW